MVKPGNDEGVCRNCKFFKTTLYGGFCYECRVAYGRRTNGNTLESKEWHEQHAMEKAEYKRKVASGEITVKTPPKGAGEKVDLDATIQVVYLRRAVVELIFELDKVGYSVLDTAKHYRQFGELREPYKTLERVRKLLEQTQ